MDKEILERLFIMLDKTGGYTINYKELDVAGSRTLITGTVSEKLNHVRRDGRPRRDRHAHEVERAHLRAQGDELDRELLRRPLADRGADLSN